MQKLHNSTKILRALVSRTLVIFVGFAAMGLLENSLDSKRFLQCHLGYFRFYQSPECGPQYSRILQASQQGSSRFFQVPVGFLLVNSISFRSIKFLQVPLGSLGVHQGPSGSFRVLQGPSGSFGSLIVPQDPTGPLQVTPRMKPPALCPCMVLTDRWTFAR